MRPTRLLPSGRSRSGEANPRCWVGTKPLEASGLAYHQPGELAAALSPASAGVGLGDGVKPPAGHIDPDMARVGVNADPPPRPGSPQISNGPETIGELTGPAAASA